MLSAFTKQTIRAFLRTYQSAVAFSLLDYLLSMKDFGWREEDTKLVLQELEQLGDEEVKFLNIFEKIEQ